MIAYHQHMITGGDIKNHDAYDDDENDDEVNDDQGYGQIS